MGNLQRGQAGLEHARDKSGECLVTLSGAMGSGTFKTYAEATAFLKGSGFSKVREEFDDEADTHWELWATGDWTAKHIKELEVEAAEAARLRQQLNIPETKDFLKGVELEAAHQRERWGTPHDAGKTDADWFWLVGYLVGKALHKPEKRLHHLITAAAALFNWHFYTLSKTDMRPGIEPPKEVAHGDV